MTQEYTFVITDACGNEAVTKANFSVEDTTAPEISAEPEHLIVSCDDDSDEHNTALMAWLGSYGGATVTDSCVHSGDMAWSYEASVWEPAHTVPVWSDCR